MTTPKLLPAQSSNNLKWWTQVSALLLLNNDGLVWQMTNEWENETSPTLKNKPGSRKGGPGKRGGCPWFATPVSVPSLLQSEENCLRVRDETVALVKKIINK